ncbi:flavodoxin [Pseudoflavonifractor capillosus]|uniref:S-layer homology domain-containing protein n=1 Tax=Pseudoflavonifractor capillosus TaxID=106588 RepID=A0A921SSU2_9FIRM|nr:flavodoxin [Pseudoflavonifractor capillosus]HJG86559.1 S-layer homology domain-containing protein [Pseudoflavonifractor capillosus]
MKNCNRIGTMLLALILTLSLSIAALAAVEDTGFSDVAADAWYADAVTYVRDNGLMSGSSETTFVPDGTMTRGMLVTTLYRLAGSPSLENENLGYPFADVPGDAWYADGVYWARLTGVVNGYPNERFGPDDPVSREQIAAILWRYAGSPAAEPGTDFADEGNISDYAAQAVDWARANGIVNGADGNRFLPQSSATRAQAATILRNYLTAEEPAEPEVPAEESRVLVAYFSATGNTERVANQISEATGGDLFEIMPADPYTDEDLNWTDEDSRVVFEYENPEERDTELVAYTPDGWDGYDVVFIGYPIWWYDAAWPVEGFVEENDFTGKTVIPFCTSSSSGLGESGSRLADLAGAGDWQEGQRFRSSAAQSDIEAWVRELGLLYE